MAEFPRNENDLLALAQDMLEGMTADAVTYPSPTVDLATFQQIFDDAAQSRQDNNAAQSTAQQATADKNAKMEILADATKKNVNYAVQVTDGDDDKLRAIGYGGRRAPTPQPVPGQPRILEVVEEDGDTVKLDWKKPIGGGRVLSYKVERIFSDNPQWQLTASVVESEVELSDQPRGSQLGYRVVAINRAGESIPSNTVTVVL